MMEAGRPLLRVYYTSDIHGHLFRTPYAGGPEKDMGLLSCAAEFIRDGGTLVFDNGDMLQGSAFAYYCRKELGSPAPLAEAVNSCSFSAITLGNHDFNYGMAYLNRYLHALTAPCVCGNIKDEKGRVLFPPVIKKMENGLLAGIAGIVTDSVNIWENPSNLEGIRVTDPFAAAAEALSELRERCDITICLYHGGFERDPGTGALLSDTTENIGYRICEELDFDILLTGHQHWALPGRYIHGTYAIQTPENGTGYALLEVNQASRGTGEGRPRFNISSRLCAPRAACRVSECAGVIPVERAVQSWLDKPLGVLPRPLKPESHLHMALYGSGIADFFNQVQLHYSGAQISATSLANTNTGFPAAVSSRDVIANYPFANTLVTVKITGAELRAVMERSAEYFELGADGSLAVARSFMHPKAEHYNYDYYANLDYTFDIAKAPGQRVRDLRFQNKAVKDSDVFTLCVNSYRAAGAGGYPVYANCERLDSSSREISELILEYIEKHKQVALTVRHGGKVTAGRQNPAELVP
jgi:2',3'-cyclic-nucleotide 2'-phosphodiesterase/3'-nucleotidase